MKQCKGFRFFLSLLLAALLGLSALSALAEENAASPAILADETARGILAFQVTRSGSESEQDWAANALLGEGGAEWYILTLIQYARQVSIAGSLDYLDASFEGERVMSASEALKGALVYCALGKSDSPHVTAALSDSVGAQGVMSYIYGLHLVNNALTGSRFTQQELIDTLLDLRKADGGWAVIGNYSDTDVTAMALQALAPHYRADERVRAATDEALRFLSAKQGDSGAFVGFGGGENPESTAQVIIALSALGIDPCGDERFIKDGNNALDGLLLFRLEDGSFCHQLGNGYNATATLQSLMACVSLWRLYNGHGSIYQLDIAPQDVEAPGARRTQQEPVSYKTVAVLIACDIALLIMAGLWLAGKRSYKNYLFTLLCLGAASLVILLTNFQTSEEYYSGVRPDKPDAVGTVSMTIRCDTIRDYTDKNEFIPADGVILPMTEFAINAGETVYDILAQAAREYGFQMDSSGSAIAMLYVKGLNHIYEYEFGEQSGWMYYVDGIAPSVNAAEYVLRDGEIIQWMYSRDIGQDLKDYIIKPDRAQ